jgi:hypothetical protein
VGHGNKEVNDPQLDASAALLLTGMEIVWARTWSGHEGKDENRSRIKQNTY